MSLIVHFSGVLNGCVDMHFVLKKFKTLQFDIYIKLKIIKKWWKVVGQWIMLGVCLNFCNYIVSVYGTV